MAKYFQQSLTQIVGPQKPQLEPLAGAALAKRSRVPPLMRSQDKIPALGRRIIATQSLRGASTWACIGGPVATGDCPGPLDERPVGYAFARVTPGCFLRLSLLYSPSGNTQALNTEGPPALESTGVGGSVIVRVTWTSQALSTTTTEHEIVLAPSQEDDGAPSTAPWATVRVAGVDLITPEIDSSSDKRRWTEHVAAEVSIYHRGGVRMVDLCLHEQPHVVVRESDDDATFWASHMFGMGSPEGPAQGLTTYAVQRWSETTPDGMPQGGTWGFMSSAAAQGLRLGPALVHWTPWGETTGTGFTTSPVVRSFSSTSFTRLWDGGAGTYSGTGVGWSMSSAAYASDAGECDDYWSDADRSVPVLVAVYADGRGTAPGVLRVQSHAFSWVDVATASTSGFNWYFGYGHLRCGKGPDDQVIAQAFMRRNGGSGTLDVAAVSVFRMGQHEHVS